MKRLIIALLALGMCMGFATTGFASRIDFENVAGTTQHLEGDAVSLPDMTLQSFSTLTGAFDGAPLYFDVAAGLFLRLPFWSDTNNGEFGMWTQSLDYNGIFINFLSDNKPTYFETEFSFGTKYRNDPHFYLLASFSNSTWDYVSGDPSKDAMGKIRISAPDNTFINYVLLYDLANNTPPQTTTGNHWVVDNIVIPEPSTVLLLAGGLITFLGYKRFRRI